ncbi:MAG: hypothetical protein GXP46_13365 [Deferribacteres bacterium]|nr:hypothetical protein [Deferribacteres bacterium]
MAISRLKGWMAVVFVLAVGLLGSCSDGGGDFAGGGISGTGLYNGVITSFGSVFVNGIEFNTSGAAITADDADVTEDDLDVGMKVTVEADGTTALRIDFDPEVIGPVQSIDTVNDRLVVMGQTVLIEGTTVLKGFGGILDLATGDTVVVSGFFDAAGNIRAVYIELKPLSTGEKVKGVVSSLDYVSRRFVINGLSVDYSALPSLGVQNGDFVEVKGSLSGGTLVASHVSVEEQVETALPGNEMAVEGVVTSFSSVYDFEINGLRVSTDNRTVYENGLRGDVALDVLLEVEGTVNDSGVLLAEKVEFLSHEETEIGIEGVVESVDLQKSTVTVFGIGITVNSSTIFNDESGRQLRSFSLSDIRAGDLIEVGGFVDGGRVVALKLERMDPSEAEYSLSGPVDAGSETGTSFSILGVRVDVSGPGVTFEDDNGDTMTAAEFFAAIDDTNEPGDIVEVGGLYQGGVFIADEVEIEKIN